MTAEGKLTCSTANISGVITATSGSFKNGTFDDCTINKNCKIKGLLYRDSTIITNNNANSYGMYSPGNLLYALDVNKTGFNIQL